VSVQTIKSREQFDAEIERFHLRGQWRFDEDVQRISKGPPPSGVPFMWKWTDISAVLAEACDVMPDSLLQRRNVSFMNPGLKSPNVTNTIAAGIQLVTPGEIAYGHRHTMGAIRFGIDGDERLFTVVDGDVLPLAANDLVLTPSWTWHDHHNEMDRNGTWLDVLDVPLLLAIDQARFQPFGDDVQPRHDGSGAYASTRAALVRPTFEARRTINTPLRYAWRDVEPILRGYCSEAASPYDDILLEYVNPATGGPTLPTIGCFIQLLRPGFAGLVHHRSAAAVYHVVEGSGVTVCGDVELQWSQHDSFVVPSWMPHRHVNASAHADAILFSATDQPLLDALGLYREAPEPASYLRPAPIAPGNRT
jgi:1-hydroxy-2-naphthoate dioxygenase